MPLLETHTISARPPSAVSDSTASAFDNINETKAEKPFDQYLDEEINQQPQAETDSDIEVETVVGNQQSQEYIESKVVNMTSEQAMPLTETEENNLLMEGKLLPLPEIMSSLLSAQTKTADNTKDSSLTQKPESEALSTSIALLKQNNKTGTESTLLKAELSTEEMTEAELADVASGSMKESVKNQKLQAEFEPVIKQELTDLNKMSRPSNPQLVTGQGAPLLSDPISKDFSGSLNQSMQLNTPVQHKQWGHEFAQRISMMLTNGQQQVAEMQLNPARMGSIAVRVQIEDDKANISFLTTQYAVKEAIEVSLPKLREQLEQQGLGLGDVDVSNRDFKETQDEHEFSYNSSSDDQEGMLTDNVDTLESVITADLNDGVSVFV